MLAWGSRIRKVKWKVERRDLGTTVGLSGSGGVL